jgi:DNA replication protein DnaC
MSTPAIDLDALLRRLHLPTVRRLYPELAQRAEQDGVSYRDYLALLMAEEVAHRAQTRIQRCVRRAHFPFLKTIEEFDFTFQASVRLALLGSVLGPELVTRGLCLIASGPSGTGKTHLAVAIAYRAIQNGFEARFTTATALIDELSTATRKGRLRHVLPAYTHPHVLVIDEVGYLSYGPDAANVLFHVVNERYLHQRPMLFTTNKPLSAWGRVLHDPDLAQAILDRVLERGRLLELRGPSFRTRHAKLDLNQDPEPSSSAPARISGNRLPEFPEPTAAGRLRRDDWVPGPASLPDPRARGRVHRPGRNWRRGLVGVLRELLARQDLRAGLSNLLLTAPPRGMSSYGRGRQRGSMRRSATRHERASAETRGRGGVSASVTHVPGLICYRSSGLNKPRSVAA